MQSTSNGRQFLFVDKSKSFTQLSKFLPHEKATVQRYVQTGRKRPRNVKSKELPDASSNPLNRFRNAPIVQASTHDSRRGNSNVEDAEENQDSPAMGENASRVCLGQNKINQNAQQPITPLANLTSLSRRDPFDAASVPINRSVAGLLDYYIYYYHPSLWPNEMILLRHGVYAFPDSVRDIMKTAVTDKLTMYCLLSASVCRVKFIDHLPLSLAANIESYFIREALQLMYFCVTTTHLEETNEINKLIISLMLLSSAESYRSDFFAAKAHLAPIARILQPLGGLAFVEDDNVRGQLAMADLALACVDLDPCLFDCSYNPGPASTLDLSASELHTPYKTSTASLLLQTSEQLVIPELRVLVEELVETHLVKAQISTSSMNPERAMEVTHWISLRNMAIRHRLLSLKTSDPRVHALRLALIMWSLLFNITGRIKTVKLMAPMLKTALFPILASSWAGNEDLRSWLVLLGFYCSKEGSPEASWFMGECYRLNERHLPTAVGVPFSDLLERLEAFQLQFFYDIPLQNRQTRSLSERLRTVCPYS